MISTCGSWEAPQTSPLPWGSQGSLSSNQSFLSLRPDPFFSPVLPSLSLDITERGEL